MPFIEYPNELAEHIADLVGVYGEDRIGFVVDIENRIIQSVATADKRILNGTHSALNDPDTIRRLFEDKMKKGSGPMLMRNAQYDIETSNYVEISDPDCVNEDVTGRHVSFEEGWKAAIHYLRSTNEPH